MGSPVRGTFKNPNFRSLCEFSQWYSGRPKFKSPNFESIEALGKVKVSLLKLRWKMHTTAGHIANLMFHFVKFQELVNE